jgi:hypothetical protein
LDVEIQTTDTAEKHHLKALLDCGATRLFLDKCYVNKNGLPTRQLQKPVPVLNVDGTPNEAGAITHVVDLILHYKEHAERTLFAVTFLGSQEMILGLPWLCKHNPEVDWQSGEVKMTRCD